jgi:4-aminobutyrate aminotransferase-like enzyme
MGSTFGGNVVACAAANATIEVMREEDLLGNAARQGDKLMAFFKVLQQTYPAIGDVRGKVLIAAIEIVKPATHEPDAGPAKAFVAEAAKRNTILMGAGSYSNCVRFLPPLVVTDADMEHAFGVFEEVAQVVF